MITVYNSGLLLAFECGLLEFKGFRSFYYYYIVLRYFLVSVMSAIKELRVLSTYFGDVFLIMYFLFL